MPLDSLQLLGRVVLEFFIQVVATCFDDQRLEVEILVHRRRDALRPGAKVYIEVLNYSLKVNGSVLVLQWLDVVIQVDITGPLLALKQQRSLDEQHSLLLSHNRREEVIKLFSVQLASHAPIEDVEEQLLLVQVEHTLAAESQFLILTLPFEERVQ